MLETFAVGDGNRAKRTQIVSIRGAGDTDDGRATGEGQLRDEATHASGSRGDHDDVTRVGLHAAHGAHRGLRSNAQAAGDLEADGSGLADDIVGSDNELGRERTVLAHLPGGGAQEADDLIPHRHVGHSRANGCHDAREILPDAAQRQVRPASEPTAGVNDRAEDLEGPRQSAEELVVDGVDTGGPHGNEHLSLAGRGE